MLRKLSVLNLATMPHTVYVLMFPVHFSSHLDHRSQYEAVVCLFGLPILLGIFFSFEERVEALLHPPPHLFLT